MDERNIQTQIRHEIMVGNGVKDPAKVDAFVEEIYEITKTRGFSVVEFDEIIKGLNRMLERNKRLILMDPLKTMEH